MFHLQALGGLVFESGSETLPVSAHQRRRLTLLVLLASAGARGMSRDRLLAYLWPESSAKSAQHALDQLLYATRRGLGKDAIISHDARLRLEPEIVRSDFVEFEACLARGEEVQAIALYTGRFLDGVHLSGAVELDQWVEAERSRLEERFVKALEDVAVEAGNRGDFQAGVVAWRRRAAAEPLSARGALGLMKALMAVDDRAGAIQYARTYSKLVRAELEIEPDAAVVAFAAILAGELAAETHPRSVPGAARLAGTGDLSLGTGDPSSPMPSQLISAATSPNRVASDGGREVRRRLPWVATTRWRTALVVCMAVVISGTALLFRRASILPAHPVNTASVAVLPFEDLSGDGSVEYLGDGMAEELIHALALVPDLRVSARTSAFAFKGRRQDIREIARALGVSAMVEGSVRREGDRLRVTAQLIDATNGYHLWSGSFDRRMGDALATQDEIARSLVQALRPKLMGRESPVRTGDPPNARAYHLYLQGRYAGNQRTEAALRKAVRLFEQAIAEHPDYAVAYAGLASAHDELADGGFAPAEQSYRKAEAAARRAIQLDGTLAEAHASLGHIEFHRWDWPAAERQFKRALELNPGYAGTYGHYAMPLVMQGRFDEGLAMARKAQELDPLSMSTHDNTGWLLFLARRHGEAIEQLRVVIAMDSTSSSAHARLGLSMIETGRYEEGIASLERAVELEGEYYRSALPMLGYAYAKSGRGEDAERIRARVEGEMAYNSLNPYYGAAMMAALGKKDRAFALLDHAFKTNKGCLIDLGVDPMMDLLRPDPRYGELARALGMQANAKQY